MPSHCPASRLIAMSWTEKEIKKRRSREERSTPSPRTPKTSEQEATERLWNRIDLANKNLPAELQLETQRIDPPAKPMLPTFRIWLRAPNGAAIGCASDAIRYIWPKANAQRSNNFWIRWNFELQRHVVVRRMGNTVRVYRFDERRIDYLIRRLVMGRIVAASALRVRRFWLI